jgi:hypothetical protein
MSTTTSFPESKKASEELELLSTLCLNWRQNRVNKFSPMPSYLEQYISNIIISGNHTDLEIMGAAKINNKKFTKIAAGRTNHSPDHQTEFVPFTLIPQTINTNNTKFNKSTFKTASDAHNLTINTANGDSISIPVSINDSILQNIIKLFLCCK